VFRVADYLTLPTSYALPINAGVTRGFTFRTVAAPQDTTNTLDSTVARAKAQLAGTLIDPATGQPYTNAATLGTNADGSFNMDTVINFSDFKTDWGDFPDDQQFPGIESFPFNWYSTEANLFLNLPAGYYRFGVNSDDGFQLNVLPPAGRPGAPIQLGIYDDGRSADDSIFDFQVLTSGVYAFQLIFFESTGDASLELFSVDLPTNQKILVNDTNATAIASYRTVKPLISRIVKSGNNVVLDWAYGSPPFQVEAKTNITDLTWTPVGGTTTNRTATIPITTATRFFRVYGQ
jgi:hypothetical protein